MFPDRRIILDQFVGQLDARRQEPPMTTNDNDDRIAGYKLTESELENARQTEGEG